MVNTKQKVRQREEKTGWRLSRRHGRRVRPGGDSAKAGEGELGLAMNAISLDLSSFGILTASHLSVNYF